MDRFAINITFDENNQIRVLEADKYRESEKLVTEWVDFEKKIVTFNENVQQLIVSPYLFILGNSLTINGDANT